VPSPLSSSPSRPVLLAPLTRASTWSRAPVTGLPSASTSRTVITVGVPATPFGTMAELLAGTGGPAVTVRVAVVESVVPATVAETTWSPTTLALIVPVVTPDASVGTDG